MTDDFRRRVQRPQSGLEKLAGIVPGYQGYKERELRREADKLLRTYLADHFDEQRRRLVNVMAQLTNAGRLNEMLPLEKANLRLQLLIDSLRTAAYGYGGLFAAEKIEQAELDALYEYDSALAGGIEHVAGVLGTVEGQVSQGESISAQVNALLNVLQELNMTFGRRSEAFGKA